MGTNVKRNTIQKKIVFDVLKKSKNHPTAHALYDIIRKKMPTISLGTIYRNLEILSEEKIVKKLRYADKEKRYEAIIKEHYHIKCEACGKIEDLTDHICQNMEEELKIQTEYQINGHTLLFYGICPDCKKK